MACLNPIRAYRKIGGSSVMWREPSLATRQYYRPFPVPCGKCYGCRLEYSRQWAVRMTLESTLHNYNYFLTLSYAPEHLPDNATLVKKDLQDFHKRLRIHYSRYMSSEFHDIRYYCCGEYGEKRGRPHYHGIYFNLFIPDLKLYKESQGNKYFRSDLIEQLWGKGMVIIAGVSFDSCGYVARYVTKKVDWRKNRVIDNKFNKVPEFSLMSRNPAIGFRWLEKYWQDTYRDDFVVVNGRKIKPPKYFDNIIRECCKDVNPDFWNDVKKRRVENRREYEDDYYDVRLPSIRRIANQRFKKLIRTIEQEN